MKTFMHKHTFSGPGARLKESGPWVRRNLELSNSRILRTRTLGPENLKITWNVFMFWRIRPMKWISIYVFFCACPNCSLQLQQQSTCTRIHKPVDLIHTYFPSLKSRKYTNTHTQVRHVDCSFPKAGPVDAVHRASISSKTKKMLPKCSHQQIFGLSV